MDPQDLQKAIDNLLENLDPALKELLPDALPPEQKLLWLAKAKSAEKRIEAKKAFKPYPVERRLV